MPGSRHNRGAIAYLQAVLGQFELTPHALAVKAGVAPSTLTKPLTNPDWKSTISIRTLDKVREATNVDYAPFLTGRIEGVSRQSDVLESADRFTFPTSERKGGEPGELIKVIATAGVDLWTPIRLVPDRFFVLPFATAFKSIPTFGVEVADAHCNQVAQPNQDILLCSPLRNPEESLYRADTYEMLVLVQRIDKDKNSRELTVRRAFRVAGAPLYLQYPTDDPAFRAPPEAYDPDLFSVAGLVEFSIRNVGGHWPSVSAARKMREKFRK